MHHSAYVNAEKFYHKYCKDNIENKKILDVGSYDVNGTMKPIFQKGQYIGLDMEQGPNVDIVGVSHKIPFKKDEFDIVISSSCFEHDDMFWVSFQEMCRVLKPGGYMYIQAPSNGPYHGWPSDNWRFYIDSWKSLEKWGKTLGYDMELVEHYIDDTTPHHPSEGIRIWNDSIGIYRKKPIKYKKVALISTFCDTPEKLKVLEKNIDNVRTCGLDVIVISPIFIPENIQKKCDYFFLMKDNRILDWPERAMFAWKHIVLDDKTIKITNTYPDYGWAGLFQVKKLSEIALSFDYDYFYHMIYDLKFDETVVEGLLSEKECDIYSSKRDNTIWKAGLHFMIFNREKLKTFIEYITLENYLKHSKGGDAFFWLQNLINKVNFNIIDTPVEDEIFVYKNIDFLNLSPINGLKFFIENDDDKDSTIKILFYDNNDTKNVSIKIEDQKQKYEINNNKLIDLGFDKKNIPYVFVEYDNVSYDITDVIKKIKHSTLNLI